MQMTQKQTNTQTDNSLIHTCTNSSMLSPPITPARPPNRPCDLLANYGEISEQFPHNHPAKLLPCSITHAYVSWFFMFFTHIFSFFTHIFHIFQFHFWTTDIELLPCGIAHFGFSIVNDHHKFPIYCTPWFFNSKWSSEISYLLHTLVCQ